VSIQDILATLLARDARDRGVAAASIVTSHGADPVAAWVPDLAREPRFLVYSITKTFTAALILRLCEEGKLQLDYAVARWFPDVPRASRMTIRHLLNHAAGIPDYGGLAAYHNELRSSPKRPWSFDRFATETFRRGLLFEPGTGWSYSNPGYMLLKGIAEQVGGNSYAELIADYITGPLDLRDTAVVESLDDMRSLAPGTSCFLAPNGEARDIREYYHPGWVSHGVIASSCTDVARFLDALFGAVLLSRRFIDEMLELTLLGGSPEDERNSSPLRPASPGYGLGVMGDPDSPWGLLVGHNGGGPCYSASGFHAMKPGVSVCSMAAIEQGFSTEAVVAQAMDAVIRS
jgi:D-alanyl-D-alanine carboxypeptidase